VTIRDKLAALSREATVKPFILDKRDEVTQYAVVLMFRGGEEFFLETVCPWALMVTVKSEYDGMAEAVVLSFILVFGLPDIIYLDEYDVSAEWYRLSKDKKEEVIMERMTVLKATYPSFRRIDVKELEERASEYLINLSET